MKFEDADKNGSFTVWGSGFDYKYISFEKALHISAPQTKRVLAKLKFDDYISRDPQSYIIKLNKANQIKALNLSNNRSNNLLDIIDNGRIGALINNTASTSYFAQMLEDSNYNRFSSMFTQGSVLHNIAIKKFSSRDNMNVFFVARAQTVNENTISARGCDMASLLAALSERTLRDLITLEFGDKFQNTAHELLKIATKFSAISAVIDPHFIPENFLKKSKLSTADITGASPLEIACMKTKIEK
ncbi:MAG: hypothetical protein KTR28_03745 [Micavibrio sp.]|nr:hypothetical protein [Micavibrio sp.]